MSEKFIDKELKIFQKVLMDHSFEKNGVEYYFLSIEKNEEGWAYDIVVNVVTPNKDYSYATPVFSKEIHEILANIWKYIGSSFSYSEQILVNGKEPADGGLYIRPEKQREIISKVRKEFEKVAIKTSIGRLLFDVYWRPMEKFYHYDDVYIDFNFNIEISKFYLDGKYVKPDLKIADDIAGAISELMYDSDVLRDKLNDIPYEVMGKELNIMDVDDLYYQVRFFITKMDGFRIVTKWGDYFDLEDGMFT